MSKKPRRSPDTPAGGLAEWEHRSVIRDVVLPSGMTVDLRAIRLEELASLDALPTDLQHVALLHQTGTFEKTLVELAAPGGADGVPPPAAVQLIDANTKLVNRVVRAGIAGPPLLVEELGKLPADDPLRMIDGFDKEMIAEIVQRIRATDATGRRVYGAQALHTFPGADPK